MFLKRKMEITTSVVSFVIVTVSIVSVTRTRSLSSFRRTIITRSCRAFLYKNCTRRLCSILSFLSADGFCTRAVSSVRIFNARLRIRDHYVLELATLMLRRGFANRVGTLCAHEHRNCLLRLWWTYWYDDIKCIIKPHGKHEGFAGMDMKVSQVWIWRFCWYDLCLQLLCTNKLHIWPFFV